jgi:hypothetical protein
MLVAKSFHLSYHNSPSIPLYLQLHNISDHISFISTYYVSIWYIVSVIHTIAYFLLISSLLEITG